MSPPTSAAPRRSARLATTGSVWVVRHGQRADQADGDWWLTAPRPHDPELTALGERQAAAAGTALAAGCGVQEIYSSPFLRCVQTAAQCAKALGIDTIRIEPGLGEMLHEEWFDFRTEEHPDKRHGMPMDSGMSDAALRKRFGSLIDTSYSPLYDAVEREPGRASSCEKIHFPEHWHEGVDRYERTLKALRERSPFALLVTHGAGVQACAETAEGVDMAEMDIDYCCLTNLHRQGAWEWKCATLASAKHTADLE